jgi:membrane-associated phospholipid phosphatase
VSDSGHGLQQLLTEFITHRTPVRTAIAVAITSIGSPLSVGAIAIVVGALWSWRRHSWLAAQVLLLTLSPTAAANTLVKETVARFRPPLSTHLVHAAGFSYPSGHTAGTTALAGAMLLIYLPTSTAPRRALALTAAACAVTAVAASRLYLGVHWLTDVAGATLLACTIVLAAAPLTMTVLRGDASLEAADEQPREGNEHPAILPLPHRQSHQRRPPHRSNLGV